MKSTQVRIIWRSLFILYIMSSAVYDVLAVSNIYNASALLHATLMEHYIRDDRPGLGSPMPVPVAISFHLTSIMDLNELDGEMVSVGYLNIKWVDTRLMWNPLEYSGMTSLMLTSTMVWTPNIVLGNPSKKVTNFNADIAKVRVLYNGTVILMPGDVFQTRCEFNIYHYPFDDQECHLSFLAWPYMANEVMLKISSKNIRTPFFQENGEWYLRSSASHIYIKNQVSIAEFQLLLERRYEFFVVNIILPIVSLCFLACLVFLIPPESGERISYTITVLLSFAVFMTLVSDNIPKTSAPMSLLCYYLFALFFGSVLIMLNVIFNNRIFHRDPSIPVPSSYKKIATCFRCKTKSQRMKSRNKIHVISVNDINMADETKMEMTNDKQTRDANKKTSSKNKDGKVSVTWQDVARTMDHVCFVMYIIYFLCLSCGIVIYVQCSSTAYQGI